MAVLLGVVREPTRPCSYLDATPASLVHQRLLYVSPAEMDAMLERGWRRFGSDYFRPACSPCPACSSSGPPFIMRSIGIPPVRTNLMTSTAASSRNTMFSQVV